MEIASIKGDTVLFLYHPGEAAADVGQQFTVLELPEKTEGLVVQIISNDSLEYPGLQQEMIQRVLERRISDVEVPIDRELGMGEIKSLKLAMGRIRKRVRGGEWVSWDGWIPTRNVEINRIEAPDLLLHIVPEAEYPLPAFSEFNGSPIQFDGPRLNMVSVITGVKGSGKSHLAKHLLLSLAERSVPTLVFDINGEYVMLPQAQVLRWGDNFVPQLAEVGYDMLRLIVRALYPLQPGSPSESVFENRLPNIFNSRRTYCQNNNEPFTIDIPFLRGQTWGGGDLVAGAIDNRLAIVDRMALFWSTTTPGDPVTSISQIYENACDGRPAVFDMRELGTSLQEALVRSVLSAVEDICERETSNGTARYPFILFEEAHFYVSEDTILNIITRGRHIGIASIFITNTPHRLPDTVFRQLDNLFLLALAHRDDIRNVSRNSFTDEDTIESFATRMPEKHALIIGNVTDRYPLVLSVRPLPEDIPPTGRTRSTWDRFSPGTGDSPQQA
jgi:hypothetical protein